eukprot:g78156.t1
MASAALSLAQELIRADGKLLLASMLAALHFAGCKASLRCSAPTSTPKMHNFLVVRALLFVASMRCTTPDAKVT